MLLQRDKPGWAPLLLATFLVLVPISEGHSAELEGQVVLQGQGARSEKVAQAVVWWTPADEVLPETPAEPFEIITARKEFQPKVLVVPLGSEVRFPNADPILHNVFSVSPIRTFDLGFYRSGESKSVTFDKPGVVRVYCNVHHSMVAHVVVLDTPWHVSPKKDGRFRLEGLPPGPGTLTVWHERGEPQSIDLVLPTRDTPRLEIEMSGEKVPRHKNKFGKPYPRRRRGYS